MSDIVYLTKGRLLEIEKEANDLKTRGRREMAQKIADARSHGDLSENADYDAAKEEQGLMELKISKMDQILSKSQVISPDDFPNDKVYILSKVKIKNLKLNRVIEYQLVSDAEADFEQMMISVSSPLGKGLLGKVIGDFVEIHGPAGKMEFEVLDIFK